MRHDVFLNDEIRNENRSKRGVVIHEAGHFFAARAMGFAVEVYKISRHPRAESYSGYVQSIITEPIAAEDALDAYIRRRLTVINAGALAQAFDGERVNATRLAQIRADNGADDVGKARELFALYYNRRLGQGLEAGSLPADQWDQHPFWRACDDHAVEIVRENWPMIERIAADADLKLGLHSWTYGRTATQLLEVVPDEDSSVTD